MQVESNNHNQFDNHSLIYHDNKLKCICQLCTCGNHKCPRPRVKGSYETSYNHDYQQFKINSSAPKGQYKYEMRHYSPDVLTTNYQQNYVEVPIKSPETPSKFQQAGSRLIYNHVPFSGSSSYKDQYKPFKIQPVDPNPQSAGNNNGVPSYVYRPQVKFEGQSSYKAQFIPPPQPERNNYVGQNMVMPSRVHVPFYGSTSYKDAYPEYKFQTKAPQPNEYRVKVPHVKFQGKTSYNDQYKPYRLDAPEASRVTHHCMVEELNVPTVNYINNGPHIYYDPERKKFL